MIKGNYFRGKKHLEQYINGENKWVADQHIKFHLKEKKIKKLTTKKD
jgi:hypothetical protein